MAAKRFNELVIVTTAPYIRTPYDIIDSQRTMRETLDLESMFGSSDCSCDICQGNN